MPTLMLVPKPGQEPTREAPSTFNDIFYLANEICDRYGLGSEPHRNQLLSVLPQAAAA
jgi:hypothetical protein